jgi:hypothetical protein
VVVRLEQDVTPQRRVAGAVLLVADQHVPDARRRRIEPGLGRVDRQVRLARPVRPVFEIGNGEPGSRIELGRLHECAGGRVVRNDPLDPAELQVYGAVPDGRAIDVASETLETQEQRLEMAVPAAVNQPGVVKERRDVVNLARHVFTLDTPVPGARRSNSGQRCVSWTVSEAVFMTAK